TWAGIGNVEAVLVRAPSGAPRAPSERVLLRSGVVGYQIPAVRSQTVAVAPPDPVVLPPHGLQTRFGDPGERYGSAAALAHDLLQTYGRVPDDALVLVARFLEPPRMHP